MKDETKEQIERHCERHLETFVLDGRGFTRTDIVKTTVLMAERQDKIATNRTVEACIRTLRNMICAEDGSFTQANVYNIALYNAIQLIEKLKSK